VRANYVVRDVLIPYTNDDGKTRYDDNNIIVIVIAQLYHP